MGCASSKNGNAIGKEGPPYRLLPLNCNKIEDISSHMTQDDFRLSQHRLLRTQAGEEDLYNSDMNRRSVSSFVEETTLLVERNKKGVVLGKDGRRIMKTSKVNDEDNRDGDGDGDGGKCGVEDDDCCTVFSRSPSFKVYVNMQQAKNLKCDGSNNEVKLVKNVGKEQCLIEQRSTSKDRGRIETQEQLHIEDSVKSSGTSNEKGMEKSTNKRRKKLGGRLRRVLPGGRSISLRNMIHGATSCYTPSRHNASSSIIDNKPIKLPS